jgi:hypothetical protein
MVVDVNIVQPESAFYINSCGEGKNVTYEEKSKRSAVLCAGARCEQLTLKSTKRNEAANEAESREIFAFASKIKFYVMRRVNTAGSVRRICRPQTSTLDSRKQLARRQPRDATSSLDAAHFASKSIFFIKKNRDVLYILMMMIEK